LIVWQKAMDLVVAIYKITQSFPKTEVYGLASQMQRAAVSVPSNIAEGHGLKQTQAYARHLAIANGSLTELDTTGNCPAARVSHAGERIGNQPSGRSGTDVSGPEAQLAVPPWKS
jgi:hypothetical protein